MPVRLCSGSLPSLQLDKLAASHPFVDQIDVVFPSHTARHDAFTSLESSYSTARFTLSALYTHASSLAIPDMQFKALPVPGENETHADDTWCIDPRGILTLSVSKTLYEQLGVVGKKLLFKRRPERYVINVPLKRATATVGMQARYRAALDVWDRARDAEGLGAWTVAYVGAEVHDDAVTGPSEAGHVPVTPRVHHQTDVHVPYVGDLAKPAGSETADTDQEQEHECLEAFFEWVGMACLHAQRLHANDRVDPYVAVYEVPSPSSVGDVTHVRWKGLMDSTFVRSVIDTAVSILSASHESDNNAPFIAITLHSNFMTPVSYISPEHMDKEAPVRVPGLEAEDTVCLMLSKSSSDRPTWAIAQSIGKWDTRWG